MAQWATWDLDAIKSCEGHRLHPWGSEHTGVLIGNGLSRKGYDLERLRGRGLIVGCNDLIDDFAPDILVALDKHQIEKTRKIKQRTWQFLTRDENDVRWICLDGLRIATVHQLIEGKNNNSGLMGLAYLAQVVGVRRIYMIGMDFFQPVVLGRTNDMYCGDYTECLGIDLCFTHLTHLCPDVDFVRVGAIAPLDIDFWIYMCEQSPNLRLISYDEFESE